MSRLVQNNGQIVRADNDSVSNRKVIVPAQKFRRDISVVNNFLTTKSKLGPKRGTTALINSLGDEKRVILVDRYVRVGAVM